MNVAANNLVMKGLMRVAICVADESRRKAFSRLVAECGHVVVADPNTADVVLAEGGDLLESARCPVVVIGGGDDDVAGALSRGAMQVRSMRRCEPLLPD